MSFFPSLFRSVIKGIEEFIRVGRLVESNMIGNPCLYCGVCPAVIVFRRNINNKKYKRRGAGETRLLLFESLVFRSKNNSLIVIAVMIIV